MEESATPENPNAQSFEESQTNPLINDAADETGDESGIETSENKRDILDNSLFSEDEDDLNERNSTIISPKRSQTLSQESESNKDPEIHTQFANTAKKRRVLDIKDENDQTQSPVKKKKSTISDYYAGTSKTGALYDDPVLISPVEPLGSFSAEFSDKDFKTYHKARRIYQQLKDLEEKQKLVSYLPPQDFRTKLVLEKKLAKVMRHFAIYSDHNMDSLKSKYKLYFLPHQKFLKWQKLLQSYKDQVWKLQESQFHVVPYTPCCTPWNDGRRYLTINNSGSIWVESKTSLPMVTVDMYDRSVPNYWFEADALFDVGYLDSKGIVLAQSGYFEEGTNNVFHQGLNKLRRHVKVQYRLHDNSIDHSVIVELVKGDYITTVSLNSDNFNVCFKSGIVRQYSRHTGVAIGIEKQLPVVATISNSSCCFAIHVKDTLLSEFVFSYRDKSLSIQYAPFPIKAEGNIISNRLFTGTTVFDLIRAVFFDESGRPCFVDCNEYVHVFNGSTFNTVSNLLSNFNSHNKSHGNLAYYPIGMNGDQIQVLKVKDPSLENRYSNSQAKFNKAQAELLAHKSQLKSVEKKHRAISRQRTVDPDQDKALTEEEQSHRDRIDALQKVLDSKASHIVKALDKKNYFVEKEYNYPWFPLAGITNFKIEMCVDSAQEHVRNTVFNAPNLLKQAEENSEEASDAADGLDFKELFGDIEEDDKFSEFISQQSLDSELLRSNFFIGKYQHLVSQANDDVAEQKSLVVQQMVKHDQQLLKVMWQSLEAGKQKLSFHIAKQLKLKASFLAVEKICSEMNKPRLQKAIQVWRSRRNWNGTTY